MTRFHRLMGAIVLASGVSCGSTSGALVTLPFSAGGQAAGPLTFTNPTGWTVTLRNGLVIIQVTRQVVVDALDPTLQDVTGGADGETGVAVAVEIDLFAPDDTQPPAVCSELAGNVGVVAGTASKGGTTLSFRGPITIDTNLVTPQTPLLALQRVRGAAVNLD